MGRTGGTIAVGAALALLAAGAPSAQAATVRVIDPTYDSSCRYGGCENLPSTVIFSAARGEANRVTVSKDEAAIVIRDAGAPITSRRCGHLDANTVTCPSNSYLEVKLGDADDQLNVLSGGGRFFGGPGADRLDGGPAGEVLTGGSGADELRGGPGDDELLDGVPRIPRGARDDDVFDGGDGRDRVDYEGRVEPVTIRLGEAGAPTGQAGESDRLTEIENARGGLAGDLIVGDALRNELDGGIGPGRDLLDGGDGNDKLQRGSGGDTLRGGPGSDWLTSYDTRGPRLAGPLERLECGPDPDTADPYWALVADDCENVAFVGETIRNGLPLRSLDDPVLAWDEADQYPSEVRIALRVSGIAAFKRRPRRGTVLGAVRARGDTSLYLSERGKGLLRRYGAIRTRVVVTRYASPLSYYVTLRDPAAASARR